MLFEGLLTDKICTDSLQIKDCIFSNFSLLSQNLHTLSPFLDTQPRCRSRVSRHSASLSITCLPVTQLINSGLLPHRKGFTQPGFVLFLIRSLGCCFKSLTTIECATVYVPI